MRSLSCCGHLVQMALLHSLFLFFFCFTYLLEIKVLLALYQIYDSNTYRTALGFFYIYISMFEFILNSLNLAHIHNLN